MESITNDIVPPSRAALAEALALSDEILKNLELGGVSLTSISLKASRLGRLLNDFVMEKMMEYEAGGYPTETGGVPPPVWEIAIRAGRKFDNYDPTTKKTEEQVY